MARTKAKVRVDLELYECAALNHAWEPSPPNPHYARVSNHSLFLTCVRCGSEKCMDIDMHGEIYNVTYYYSDRYRDFLDDESTGGYSKAHYRTVLYKHRPRRLKSVAS